MTNNAKIKQLKKQYKSTLNLNMSESRAKAVLTFFVGIIIIAVICAGVSKFGVYDRLSRLSSAAEQYNNTKMQSEALAEKLSDYSEIEKEYRIWCLDWLEDEKVAVDRRDVLNLIENEMMTRGLVRSISISGMTLNVSMSDMSLVSISAMIESLEGQPIVEKATLNGAQTESRDNDAVLLNFSVTVTLKAAESEADK